MATDLGKRSAAPERADESEVADMRSWWLFPIVLIGSSILAAVALVVWGSWLEARLHTEIFKALVQGVLVVGFGGVGSFLVKEYNRSRDRVEHRRGLLREAHKDLIHSYNEIKRLRRLLRAQAMHPTYHDPQAVVYRDSYGPLLEQLSESQLQLEDYVRRIKGNHDIYSDPQDLVENLNRAENYVGNLITEWEDNLGLFQGDPPQRTLTRLPALGCFLGDAKTAFKPCMADPMATVLDALSRAIAACV